MLFLKGVNVPSTTSAATAGGTFVGHVDPDGAAVELMFEMVCEVVKGGGLKIARRIVIIKKCSCKLETHISVVHGRDSVLSVFLTLKGHEAESARASCFFFKRRLEGKKAQKIAATFESTADQTHRC